VSAGGRGFCSNHELGTDKGKSERQLTPTINSQRPTTNNQRPGTQQQPRQR